MYADFSETTKLNIHRYEKLVQTKTNKSTVFAAAIVHTE